MRNADGTFAHGSKHLVRHGKAQTKIYRVWSSMKSRCLNTNDTAFKNYGGRGITLCERWHQFENFYADMGDPAPGQTLDRKDNDGPYTPENCRWASRNAQNRNRRGVIQLTVGALTKSVTEWAEISGVSATTIRARLRNGWPAEVAVFEPLVSRRKGVPKGQRIVVWTEEAQAA